MRARLAALLAVVGGLMSLPVLDAVALPPALGPCPNGDDKCAQIVVPLDRSGAVPGNVALRLDIGFQYALSERRHEHPPPAPDEPEDPPLLVIGGAPGQAITSRLDPHSIGVAHLRTVLLMDLRGSGRSSPLRCPSLQRRAGISRAADAAAECAAALGARRGFYTARDSAEDLEAVRRALGVEKIALLGISYGARVAVTYAQRYPAHVDRLLLQSPPAPEGEDLLYRSTFAAVPGVVRAWCRGRACRRASRAPVGDMLRLARRLERGPISAPTVDGSGRRRSARLDARDLLEALGGGPFAFFSDAHRLDLPGLVRDAVRGDAAPLLRILRSSEPYRRILASPDMARYFSAATYAASMCEESVLPWPRDAPLEDRVASASALASGLPAQDFHPFGPRTALGNDLVDLCRRWPVASAPPDRPHVLPTTPTLIIAGEQDLAAPVAHAEAVGRLIPGARVLRVPGFGWELSLEVGPCIGTALEAFFTGRAPPASCGPAQETLMARPAPPLSLAEVDPERGTRGRPGRTLAAVRLTLRDGAAMIPGKFFARLLAPGADRRDLYGSPVRTGALRHGTYRLGFRRARFALRDASYVPGVRVSGSIAPFDQSRTHRSRGHLRVGGPAAARGRLVLRGHVLSGRLGGRPVRMRIGAEIYPNVSFGR